MFYLNTYLAKDDIVGLVVGIAVLGGAAYAISKGYLGQAVDALLNLKLPDIGGGGDSGDGGGGTDTGGGGGGTTDNSATTKVSVSGDWGSGDNNNWQKVVAQMEKFGPAVVVDVGDKSYRGGVAKWTPVVTAIKKFAKFIGVTGNH